MTKKQGKKPLDIKYVGKTGDDRYTINGVEHTYFGALVELQKLGWGTRAAEQELSTVAWNTQHGSKEVA